MRGVTRACGGPSIGARSLSEIRIGGDHRATTQNADKYPTKANQS
jgi:hypothetical protein